MLGFYREFRNIHVPLVHRTSLNDSIYLAYGVTISIIMSWFLSSYSIYFPDFSNYENYVIRGTSFVRFFTEPLGAAVMYAVHVLGGGSYEYYCVTIFSLCLSYVYALYRIQNKAKFFTLLFLILNPINLMLIHTPRYAFAMSIALFAFFSSGRKKIFLLFLSVLSHNVMGFFACVFVFTSGLKNSFNIIITIVLSFGFYLVLIGVVPLSSANFVTSEVQRGVGRTLLFLAFCFYVLLSSKRMNNEKFYLAIMFSFVLGLYIITPFAQRLPAFFLVIFTYYLMVKQKKLLNSLLNFVILLLFVLFSFYIILGGHFGYGPG